MAQKKMDLLSKLLTVDTFFFFARTAKPDQLFVP